MGRRIIGITLALALGFTLSACADRAAPASTGGGETPRPSATAAFPVTIDTDAGDVTIATRPQRIVSLSPTATEMLFAIGAGDQVVAVDDQSNYPPEAPTTKLSGYEPNLESIAGYEPDLVVYSNDLGDVAAGLHQLDITALLQPAAASLRDVYAEIEQLGQATGHEDDALALTRQMRSEVRSIVASVPAPSTPLTYYHELDDTYYTVTSKTFIGQLYAMFGLRDIADAADKDGSGYPQLSPEYVIQRDPDLIFLADTKCCGQSAATVARRPGWSEIAAVHDGAVIELDDDVASRWGPRVVDLLRAIADAVRQVSGEAAA